MEFIRKIGSDRQTFVDLPIMVEVSRGNKLAIEIEAMTTARQQRVFGGAAPDDREAQAIAIRGARPKTRAVIEEYSHHERHRLNWVKPDGKGGFKPRKKVAR